jgi:hypothetical protein
MALGDLIPKDPNVGRWLYVPFAARHINALRKAAAEAGLSLLELPRFFTTWSTQASIPPGRCGRILQICATTIG